MDRKNIILLAVAVLVLVPTVSAVEFNFTTGHNFRSVKAAALSDGVFVVGGTNTGNAQGRVWVFDTYGTHRANFTAFTTTSCHSGINNCFSISAWDNETFVAGVTDYITTDDISFRVMRFDGSSITALSPETVVKNAATNPWGVGVATHNSTHFTIVYEDVGLEGGSYDKYGNMFASFNLTPTAIYPLDLVATNATTLAVWFDSGTGYNITTFRPDGTIISNTEVPTIATGGFPSITGLEEDTTFISYRNTTDNFSYLLSLNATDGSTLYGPLDMAGNATTAGTSWATLVRNHSTGVFDKYAYTYTSAHLGGFNHDLMTRNLDGTSLLGATIIHPNTGTYSNTVVRNNPLHNISLCNDSIFIIQSDSNLFEIKGINVTDGSEWTATCGVPGPAAPPPAPPLIITVAGVDVGSLDMTVNSRDVFSVMYQRVSDGNVYTGFYNTSGAVISAPQSHWAVNWGAYNQNLGVDQVSIVAVNSSDSVGCWAYLTGDDIYCRTFRDDGTVVTAGTLVVNNRLTSESLDTVMINSTHYALAYNDDANNRIGYTIRSVSQVQWLAVTSVEATTGAAADVAITNYNSTHVQICYNDPGEGDVSCSIHDHNGAESTAEFDLDTSVGSGLSVDTSAFNTTHTLNAFHDDSANWHYASIRDGLLLKETEQWMTSQPLPPSKVVATAINSTDWVMAGSTGIGYDNVQYTVFYYSSAGGGWDNIRKSRSLVTTANQTKDISITEYNQNNDIGFCDNNFAIIWQESATNVSVRLFDWEGETWDGVCGVLPSAPEVALIWPENWFLTDDHTPTFRYNVTDASSADINCSLMVNSTALVNQTNVILDVVYNVTSTYLVTGNYTWTVNCTDGVLDDQPAVRNIEITDAAAAGTTTTWWELSLILALLALGFIVLLSMRKFGGDKL